MFIEMVMIISQAPEERHIAHVAPLELGIPPRRQAINMPLLWSLFFETRLGNF